MKKTLILFLFLSLFLIGSVLAEEFNQTIIDNTCVSVPAMAYDKVRNITHTVWSEGNVLIYSNSTSNLTEKTNISNNYTNYNNPVLRLDSNGMPHLAFNAYAGSPYWKTFYTNSNGWIIRDTGIGNNEEEIDLEIDHSDKLYIAGQKTNLNTGDDSNIHILSSTDFINFNDKEIVKPGIQINPKLAVSSNNNISLIFFDWSDGVINGVGQYKTRYRSSSDNFVSEQNISNATQSFGADISIDSDDEVWVSFKDTTYSEQGFDKGDVFLAKKSDNWNKERVTSDSIDFMQDRPVSMAVGKNKVKHLVWTEWRNQTDVYVMYAKKNSPVVSQVADVGYNPGLGWVFIDIDKDDNPIIMANIHSLASYTVVEPTLSIEERLTLLENEIKDLKAKDIEQDNEIYYLKQVINSLFNWSLDFFNYFNSNDKCINNQLRCSGNTQQKCVSYSWVNQNDCQYGCENGNCKSAPIVCSSNSQCGTDVFSGNLVCQSNNVYQNKLTFKCNNPGTSQSSCSNSTVLTLKTTCSYGCTNGTCNNAPLKENCLTKVQYKCNGRDSYYQLYLKCASNQGTDTSCNIGKCIEIGSKGSSWCRGNKGCNYSTGLCE